MRPTNDLINNRAKGITTIFLCLCFSLCSSSWALGEPEAEPTLKPDVPKLDTTTPKKRSPLKGMVRHSESASPKLSKGAGMNAGASQNGLTAKVTNDAQSLLKAKAKQDKRDSLKAETQNGIGIIGVKFVMAFGRPPVINRVFPGTPAFENGLKINDIIVAVDGVPTFGLTKEEVFNMIVGTPNTPVSISFLRNNDFQVRRMLRMDFNDLTDPRVRRDYQSM